MTRKEIAQDLDRAANRANLIDRRPATRKQCWYLAGLLEGAGDDAAAIDCGPTNTNAVLTCARASHFIEMYR